MEEEAPRLPIALRDFGDSVMGPIKDKKLHEEGLRFRNKKQNQDLKAKLEGKLRLTILGPADMYIKPALCIYSPL